MNSFIKSILLILVLLNPFLIIIYLIEIVENLTIKQFLPILIRSGLIAGTVFCIFAIIGDTFFSDIVQADFASFQIFGGIVFLIIGLQFVFQGPTAIKILRGESEHISAAIAMPILIGPGSISASVIIGKRHSPVIACLSVLAAVIISLLIIMVLKKLHDLVRPKNEKLIQRYIEITGRIMALIVGTVSIDMIMQGISVWMNK
jgi:multiple antibiotic resistance protein